MNAPPVRTDMETVPGITPDPASTDALSTPCTQTDPEIFFPTSSRELAVASSLCAMCRNWASCRAFGVRTGSSGVFGGRLLRDGKPSNRLFEARERQERKAA